MELSQEDRFFQAVKQSRSDWEAIDVRALAMRGSDGLWHLRALRAVLVSEPPKSVLEGPRTADFWTAHEILSVDDLAAIVQGIQSGNLLLGGQTLTLQDPRQSPPRRVSLTYHYIPGDSRFHEGLYPHATHILGERTSLNFPSQDKDFHLVEMSLATLTPPWENLEDILTNFIGFQEGTLDWNGIRIEFVAPLGVRLEEVRYQASDPENAFLLGTVNGTSRTKKTDVTVAVMEHTVSGVIRRRTAELHETPRSGRWDFSHRLEPDTSRCTVICSYHGLKVGRWSHFNPKAGHVDRYIAALRHLLDGDSIEEKLLSPQTKGRELEPWAALLFAELGCRASHFGALPIESPDILAAAGEDMPLLLIECTNERPDTNYKLSKLSMRCREMASELETEVLAVLVTPMPRDSIPASETSKAGQEGIALVAQEQIRHLASMAQGQSQLSQVHAYLERCVPESATTTNNRARRRFI